MTERLWGQFPSGAILLLPRLCTSHSQLTHAAVNRELALAGDGKDHWLPVPYHICRCPHQQVHRVLLQFPYPILGVCECRHAFLSSCVPSTEGHDTLRQPLFAHLALAICIHMFLTQSIISFKVCIVNSDVAKERCYWYVVIAQASQS